MKVPVVKIISSLIDDVRNRLNDQQLTQDQRDFLLVTWDWLEKVWSDTSDHTKHECTIESGDTLARHELCKYCDHFVVANTYFPGESVTNNPDGTTVTIKYNDGTTIQWDRFVHLDDLEQVFDHAATPSGEAHALNVWRVERPDLFKEYPDRKIGPDSEYHNRRGKKCGECHGSGILPCSKTRAGSPPEGFVAVKRCNACCRFTDDLEAAKEWGTEARWDGDTSQAIAKPPPGPSSEQLIALDHLLGKLSQFPPKYPGLRFAPTTIS